MKSRLVSASRPVRFIRNLYTCAQADALTVHAAQASFFLLLSSVPFLTLFFAAAAFFLPSLPPFPPVPFLAPVSQTTPGLLSFSAGTTLWSASRGIAAVRSGIETIYRTGRRQRYFPKRLLSVACTLGVLLLLLGMAGIFLWGDFFFRFLPGTSFLSRAALRGPLCTAVLSLLFTVLYLSAARNSPCLRPVFRLHLPGGLFSAIGWMLFSRLYALYLEHFPRASAVYGSMTAVCLLMLWLYACMVIFLAGAELNKLLFISPPYTKRRPPEI